MSAEERVLQYMQDSNRPFNVQNIADMLAQFGIKKLQIERALASLMERGEVSCKEFGKAKIYMLPQEKLARLSKEELDEAMHTVNQLSKEAKSAEDEVKELQKGLSAMQSNLTLAEIECKTAALTQQVTAATEKLHGLRSGSKLVSKADRDKAEKAFLANMGHWAKRRRVFKDTWDAMSENLDRNQRDLFEEIGVETDESTGCDYAALWQLLPKKGKR